MRHNIENMDRFEIELALDHLDDYYEGNGQTERSFGQLTPFEQKVFLCNALGVSSYYSDEELGKKLEVIINAK